MQAIPTDFKGIRYRSKSEAMFAFFLHETFAHKRGLSVVYEPEFSRTANGGPVDFCLVSAQPAEKRILLSFIEYKPAEPSSAWLDHYSERACVLRGRFDALAVFPFFFLVRGSAFEPEDSHGLYFDPDSGEWIPAGPWKGWAGSHVAQEALDYRFDLKG